jgi:hypothetical protein
VVSGLGLVGWVPTDAVGAQRVGLPARDDARSACRQALRAPVAVGDDVSGARFGEEAVGTGGRDEQTEQQGCRQGQGAMHCVDRAQVVHI